MKIAVISDIHGNNLALETALADINTEPIDRIVCLGDAIQGGAQPARVVDRLRELNIPTVMGNADAWLLTGEETGTEQIPEERLRKMNDVRDWQLSQLSQDDIAFIKTFQPMIEIPLRDDLTLRCFHGSPRSFDEIILPLTPEDEVREYLEPREGIIYTGGHTHVQFMRHFGRAFHFNPGSIGLTYRHDQPDDAIFRFDPWAEYAILTVTGQKVGLEFRRVPINVDMLVDIYRSSGRPHADDMINQYRV
jgi:predicted phosphodiesterase